MIVESENSLKFNNIIYGKNKIPLVSQREFPFAVPARTRSRTTVMDFKIGRVPSSSILSIEDPRTSSYRDLTAKQKLEGLD